MMEDSVHHLALDGGGLPQARHREGSEAERGLSVEDGSRARRVPRDDWQGCVEHVKYPHTRLDARDRGVGAA
jgi:hypothetical protein